MNKLSPRWIDTDIYKTKDILIKEVSKVSRIKLKPNKSETVFTCLCPFHTEKTPSMRIYFNKHKKIWLYKCFGCGNSGDIFKFIMLSQRIEFWQALAYLKKRYKPKEKTPKEQLIIKFP